MTAPRGPSGAGGHGYPVVLDLDGRPCLVVGGGPVAARRVDGLVAAGGRVTVVALTTVTAIADNRSVEIEHRPYRRGEVVGYHLVITATGAPDVDRAVVADATAAGVLVNSADGAAPGTALLPAVLRDGPVTVAVSTGGASPALARWLRNRLASAVPAEVGVMVELLDGARRSLQAAGRPTESVDWATLLDEVLPLVEAGRIEEARARLTGL